MPVVYVGYGPGPTEQEVMATAMQAEVASVNRSTLVGTAMSALTANASDLTQDETVRAQAQAIADNPVTTLTNTQIVTVLKQLAQGVAVLASNDANAKKELNALIRLVIGALDSTDGTNGP